MITLKMKSAEEECTSYTAGIIYPLRLLCWLSQLPEKSCHLW